MPPHWSDDELVPANTEERPASGTFQPPPPQPAIERCVELFEALSNLERNLTGELLDELHRCSIVDLVKLFGAPSPPATVASTAAAVAADAPDEPQAAEVPAASPAPQEAPRPALSPREREIAAMRANLEAARYSADGRRLNPAPSVFPRQRYLPQPIGSHWSR
jgi:hypothetical protein